MEPRVFAGKYRVERELGEPSLDRTYLADGPDGERVVVKVVHPVDAAAAAAVEKDVSLISGIRHPALPTVHQWGHEGADFFVVRDYVPGADLELELGQQGKVAPVSAARYGEIAAGALAEIHKRGLTHGNIKSANLIRTPEDEIMLVGNSLGLAEPALKPDAPASAAYYMAPEQFGGAPDSPAADVYSMGVVLYELIAGKVPFDGANAAAVGDRHVHEVPTPIGEAAEDVPPALDAVVMKALEKAPEARYPDGEALRAALHSVLQPAAVPSAPAMAAAPPKRSAWPWIAVVALLVVLGLGAAWALGLFGTHEIAVPNVVGMTQSDAASAIAAAGLTLGNVTFAGQSVPGITDGSVSAESPAKDTKVDPASKVDLVLAGVEQVKVPDVVGLSQTQATIDLQGAGLVAGTITNVATTSVNPGQVLVQSPVAATGVAKGSAVDLQISQNTAAVPDVTGVARSDAEQTLENAGFVVSVQFKASASVASGRVIQQTPTGGVTAMTGSTVTITVSTGVAQVTVPDVGGMTQADAVNALTAVGFKTQVTLHTGGGPVGTVISQSPAANAKAPAGSTVQITVAQ
jgi:eukaryotic-like serine/threonine-protein kinase